MVTGQELMAAVRAKSKAPAAEGETNDSFRIRVLHRHPNAQPGTVGDLVLGMDGATAEHIATPESWFPALVGDAKAQYEFQVWHASNTSEQLGFIKHTLGRVDKEIVVNTDLVRHGDWPGPRILLYPLKRDHSSYLSSSPAPGQASPAVQPAGSPGAGASTADPYAASRAALEAEKHKFELERLRDDVMREARGSAKPAPSVLDVVNGVAPLFMTYMKDQAEQRRQDREDARKAAEAAEQRSERMIQQLATKPAPEEGTVKMLSIMGQSMTMMMQNSLQLVHLQHELRQSEQGEDEGPMWRLLSKGIDAYTATVVKTEQVAEEAIDETVNELVAGDVDRVAALESAIRRMVDYEELEPLFLAALPTEDFQAIKEEAGGNFSLIIEQRFGPWVKRDPGKRLDYLKSVLPRLLVAAEGKGLLRRKPQRKTQEPPPEPTPSAAQATPAESPRARANKQKPVPTKPPAPDASAPEEKPPAEA